MAKSAPSRAKPHILVVGGEARNLLSKQLHELFEITHVDRTYKTIPTFRTKKFDGIVILPWKHPSMIKMAKDWGDKRGIQYVEIPSIGQMRHYLALRVPRIKEYLDSLGAPGTKPKEEKKAEDQKAVETNVPEVGKKKVEELDEDTLWEAYGEPFVQKIKGLDGEVTDRATFVSLVEDETGLKGDYVETLIAVLRRQGVITETDGVVAIGEVQPIDIEKKKRFIAQAKAARKPFVNREDAGGVHGEVRDALSEEEEPAPPAPVDLEEVYPSRRRQGGEVFDDDELLGFFKTIGGARVFENQSHLFRELFKIGLRKKENGQPYSLASMRNYFNRAREVLGIDVMPVKGATFRLVIPGGSPPAPPDKVTEVAPVVVGTQTTETPSAIPTPPVEAPPQTLEELYSKPGKVYDAVMKTYPGEKIPNLAGLDSVARSIRSLFWEAAWNKAAGCTILSRLKLPTIDENVAIILRNRLDFIDEEWSYFALEWLRDQPLGSLYTMFSREEGVYRQCVECQEDFYFRFPRRCRKCFEDQKKIFENAKGGGS